jgi:hypothetical protein
LYNYRNLQITARILLFSSRIIILCMLCSKFPRRIPSHSLVLPASTRRGTLKGCFEALLKSEKLIQVVISARDFIPSTTANQQETRQHIQGDDVPVSGVYDSFLKLKMPVGYNTNEGILKHRGN